MGMSCKIKIRNDQEQEMIFDVTSSMRAEELKRMVVEQLSGSGGAVGKQVTAPSMVRLFYMGREIGGKSGDGKLEEYRITAREDPHIVIMNINIGQSAPGPSEKSSNCPCLVM